MDERTHLRQPVFKREMAAVEKMKFRVRQIAQIGMGAFCGKILSFFPHTMMVGGLRSRKKRWNCG